MSVWYYYDDETGQKILVNSDAELKRLAATGVFNADTIIENQNGKSTTAGKIQGWIGLQKKSVVPTTPDLQAIPETETTPTASRKKIIRRKSQKGITDEEHFSELRILCKFAVGFSLFMIFGSIVAICVSIVSFFNDTLFGGPGFFGGIIGSAALLSGISLFIGGEIILLIISIESHLRYHSDILDDIIDSES